MPPLTQAIIQIANNANPKEAGGRGFEEQSQERLEQRGAKLTGASMGAPGLGGAHVPQPVSRAALRGSCLKTFNC